MTDKLQALYDGLKDTYELGGIDEFRNKMNDETKRRAFYDAVSPDFDLGDYQSFNQKLGYGPGNTVETTAEANREMLGESSMESAVPEPGTSSPFQADSSYLTDEDRQAVADTAKMSWKEAKKLGQAAMGVAGQRPTADSSRAAAELIDSNREAASQFEETEKLNQQRKLEAAQPIADAYMEAAQQSKEQAKVFREEDKKLEEQYYDLTKAARDYATSKYGPQPKKLNSQEGWGKAYLEYLQSNDPDKVYEKYNDLGARNARNNTVSFLEHMANQTERRARMTLKEAEKTGAGRTVMGAGYGITQPHSWSLGMSELWTAENYISLVNKLKDGKQLTDYEQAALDAYGTFQEAASILQEYDTRGFKAGVTTGEMAPFFVQMYLNPARGLGESLAKKGVQRATFNALRGSQDYAMTAGRKAAEAMREYGTRATRDLLRDYGVDGVKARLPIAMRRLGGDLASATVLANTLQMGSTLGSIGEYKYGAPVAGEDGHYTFDPTQEKSWAEAAYKKEMAAIVEGFTEMIGEWQWLGMGEKMAKFGSKKVGQIVSALGDSDFAKGLSKLLQDAHWSGVIGETLEEEYGIILNSLLHTGDGTYSEDFKKQIAALGDLDQQIDIFLGVGLFGGVVSGANMTAYPIAYVNSKNKLSETITKNQETVQDWDDIQSKIDSADNNGLAAIVKKALYDRDAAKESNAEKAKAEAIINYINALQRYRGLNIARDLLPADADLKTMQAFYLQGYDGADKQAFKAAYEHKKAQLELLDPGVVAILDVEGIDATVRDENGNIVPMFEGDFRVLAQDYLDAKAAYKGMLDGISDRAISKARAAEVVVRGNDNNGKQIEATTRTGDKVHIISGEVVMAGDAANLNQSSKSIVIRHEDGTKEMVSPVFIKSIDNIQDTEEVVKVASERAARESVSQESQEAETPDIESGMQTMADIELGQERGQEQADYQQGDEITLPDGTIGVVNQGIGQTEDGMVEVVWNTPDGRKVGHYTADQLYEMQHPEGTAAAAVQTEQVEATQENTEPTPQQQAYDEWVAKHGDNALNKLNQTRAYAEKELAARQKELNKVQSELNDLPDVEDEAITKKKAELEKKQAELQSAIDNYSATLDRMNAIQSVYDAQNQESTAEQKDVAIRNRAAEWEKNTGVKVIILERLEDVPNEIARQKIQAGENVKGWFEKGQVYVYLPNNTGAQDFDQTFIHEVIAHKGLKEMLGTQLYAKLCRQVWDQLMTEEQKQEYLALVSHVEGEQAQQLAAADEFIAYFAEKMTLNPTAEDMTTWQQFVKMLTELLNKVFGTQITEQDLGELLIDSLTRYQMQVKAQEAKVKPKKAPKKKIKKVNKPTDFQNMRKAIEDVIDEMDFETQVRYAVSKLGHSIVWGNDPNTGTKGLGSHIIATKGGASEQDRRKYFAWEKSRRNGAKYPEEIAESIMANMPESLTEGYDTRDALRIILDAITGSSSPSDVVHQVYDDLIARQEAAEREEEERQQYAYARERGFDSYEELVIFDANEDLVPLSEEEWQQYYNSYYEEGTDGSSTQGVQGVVQQPAGQGENLSGGNEVGSEQRSAEQAPSNGRTEAQEGSNPVLPGTEGETGVIQGLEGYSLQDIQDIILNHIGEAFQGEFPEGFQINGIGIIGSRANGTAREDSDLDVLLEYEGDITEDSLFNALNGDDRLEIDGIKVDINPITPGKSGTIEEFLERNKDYKKDNTQKEAERRDERRQRILKNGTGFEKPFVLSMPRHITTIEEIQRNIGHIIDGLIQHEGDGTLRNFEGFAADGKYSRNAGEQIREYLISLDGVIPWRLLQLWANSNNLKTYDDIVAYGKKLYEERKKKSEFERKQLPLILEDIGGDQKLAQLMTNDEVADFVRLYESLAPYTDAIGEAYEKYDKDLKSNNKKVQAAARKKIDALKKQQEDAFMATLAGVYDSLLKKYGLKEGLTDEQVEAIAFVEGKTPDQVRKEYGEVVEGETPRNTSLDEVLFRIDVNHNSPYLLKKADGAFVDPITGERLGFDNRFMGSGQGSQAHGYGSYFSVKDLREYGGKDQPRNTYLNLRWRGQWYRREDAEDLFTAYDLIQTEGTVAKALQKVEKYLDNAQNWGLGEYAVNTWKRVADFMRNSGMKKSEFKAEWRPNPGHHYDVTIPDNTGTNYLEEMQTLRKSQRRRIADAVRGLEGEPARSVKYVGYKNGWSSLADMIEREQWAYQEIRDRLVQAFGGKLADEKRVSELMNSIGFDGIHYNGGWDGECYVIFNPEDAQIVDHVMFRTAPNGKKSNLTDEQWEMVRTPEFKEWFGDWESAALLQQALTAWNDDQSKKKFVFAPSERLANAYYELLGHEINQVVITDDAIRHIKKRHSEGEEKRGQVNITPEDIVTIPYILNNYDTIELSPERDVAGNRAITIKKRINGVTVVATIEGGKSKEFLVTNWKFVRSSALDAAATTPGPNVRNDFDEAKVKSDIEKIKNSAKNISKIVDENGEPLVVYHGTHYRFTEFLTPGEQYNGLIWATDRENYARLYSGKDAPRKSYELNVIPQRNGIYPLFMSVTNPFELGNIDLPLSSKHWAEIAEKLDMTPAELFERCHPNRMSYDDAVKNFNFSIFDLTRNDKFANLLKEKGYDGAIATEYDTFTKTYAVVNSNQVKSAEPATYDDNGNPIPQRKRFDKKNNDIRFRQANDRASLMGAHNISEEKLKKVLSVGGLANPSMAIVDTDKYIHQGYGDISLIPYSSTLDASRRRGVVTYNGDAWSPTYPGTKRILTSKGENKLRKLARKLAGNNDELYNNILTDFWAYADDNYTRLAVPYLLSKGEDVEIQKEKPKYSREFAKEVANALGVDAITSDVVNLRELTPEQNKALLDLLIKKHDQEVEDKAKDIKDKERADAFRKLLNETYREKLADEESNLYFNVWNNLLYSLWRSEMQHKNARTDWNATRDMALRQIEDKDDYWKWIGNLLTDEEWPEKLYAGTDNEGRPRYIPNTLENASRLMRRDKDLNSYDQNGYSATKSLLLRKMRTLSDIRRMKDQLTSAEGEKEEKDEMFDEWFDVVKQLSNMQKISDNQYSNNDYAEYRLQEAILKSNPVKYLNEEYGYDIDENSEFAKQLKGAIERMKNSPVKYFETKFNRPVYLNEFKHAIVPDNIDPEVRNGLTQAGIKVTEYESGNNEDYENKVREATEGDNDVRFRVANADQEIFVSNAERAVESISQEKATPQQWLAMIQKQGGIKAGEDKWLRLSQWLQEQKSKTMTKGEILEFIDKNKIKIEEQLYSENPSDARDLEEYYPGWFEAFYEDSYDGPGGESIEWRINNLEKAVELYNANNSIAVQIDIDDNGEITDDEFDEILDWAQEAYRDTPMMERGINPTRLSYTTEGLTNKREIALTVPAVEAWNVDDQIHFGDAGGGKAIAWIRFGDAKGEIKQVPIDRHVKDFNEPVENVDHNLLYFPKGKDRFSIEYVIYGKLRNGENGYVVAVNDGNKHIGPFDTLDKAKDALNKWYDENPKYRKTSDDILVIDEIQSKRHQNGRERGYKRTSAYVPENDVEKSIKHYIEYCISQGDSFTTAIGYAYNQITDAPQESKGWTKELVDKVANAIKAEGIGDIPDAPFEKNWSELAMKRMLRLAAEEGYDRIAWTTGDQQSERYNIGGYLSSIKRRESDDINEMEFALNLNGANSQYITTDKNGNVVYSLVTEFRDRNLADIIGKELAEKALALKENEEMDTDDITISNSGMATFYDKMLVNFMNKYGKQWGVKVENVYIPGISESNWENAGDGLTMHSVVVTPEMRRDVLEGQVMFRVANEKNKEVSTPEPELDEDIMFRVSNRDRETISKWLSKRNDLTDSERQKILDYIDTLEDKKLQLATGWWFAKGSIRIPEDMPKVEQAVQVANVAKVDPMQYSSPMELINAHANIEIKEKPINPDDVETLHKYRELPDGIVVYDVDDTEESRENMRRIIDTHFGKESSPWCLLQGDGEGGLTRQSKEYWDYYNSYPKQVAFKNGKLLAFSANRGPVRWWDRMDEPHVGIPVEGKIPNDELGRTGVMEYDPVDGEATVVGDMWKGNPDNGPFETYYDTGQLRRRSTRKDTFDVGPVEVWHKNGQKSAEFTNNELGNTEGEFRTWYPNGQLHTTGTMVNGRPVGVHETYFENGQLEMRTVYPDTWKGHEHPIEPRERFYPNGQIRSIEPYDENGIKNGTETEWFEDGQKEVEVEYVNNEPVRATHWFQNGDVESKKYWDEDGNKTGVWEKYRWDWDNKKSVPQERTTYKDGAKNGIYEEYYPNGQMKMQTNFKDSNAEGLTETWNEDGKPFLRFVQKDRKEIGHEYYDYDKNEVVQMYTMRNGAGEPHIYGRRLPMEGYTPLTEEELGTYPGWAREKILADPTMFRVVTDKKKIDELEKGKKLSGYRTVAISTDGTLGSPMAGRLGRKGTKSVPTSGFNLGQWEEAEENPDMADENGKINLIKPQGRGSVGSVDYNPYIHIRPTAVNKQFTQAWNRPELVYIETEYPESELTSGYKAEKAAKSVGRHEWNGGELILSRYDKPKRIVPWTDVADEWEKEFKDSGVTFDIVAPELLPILSERGVEILPPKRAAGKGAMDAYNRWRDNTMFRVGEEQLNLFSPEDMNGGIAGSQKNINFATSKKNNERGESDIQRKGNPGRADSTGRREDGISQAATSDPAQQSAESVIKPLRKLEEGETCYVERKLSEAGDFSFIGKDKIETIADVAFIFRKLETKAVENAFIAFVKNGKATILHVGMGPIAASLVDLTPITVMMKNINPDKVYFVHNHPSGQLISSNADRKLWQDMRKIMGDTLAPGIIIDSTRGEFGIFEGDAGFNSTGSFVEFNKGEQKIPVYRFDERVFSKDYDPESSQIRTSRDIAAFVAGHRLGERDKISVLCLDHGARVLGNFFLPYTDLSSIDTIKKIAVGSAYYAGMCGATGIVLYGNGVEPSSTNLPSLAARTFKEFFAHNQLALLDIVGCYRDDTGYYYSYADHGYVAEPGMEYRKQEALKQAEAETDTNPTQGQKEAGNYKKGHVRLFGMDLSIEQPKGSVRSGTDADGKQWSQEMHNTYGYIRGTMGRDKDHIDVFLGDNLNSDKVFVVDQRNIKDGSFDEHKVMLGFDDIDAARKAYESNYEKGWRGMAAITETTLDDFKEWAFADGRRVQPFSQLVKTNQAGSTRKTDAAYAEYDRTRVHGIIAQSVNDEATLEDIGKLLDESKEGSPEYDVYSTIYTLAASGLSVREAKDTIINESANATESIAERRMEQELAPVMEPLTQLAGVNFRISREPSRVRSEYNNGDIVVYNPKSAADVQAAVMRESYTHKDIRNVPGWDALTDAAYRLSEGEIASRAMRGNMDFEAATEEWMYENAERMVAPFELMMSRNRVNLLYRMTGDEIRMYLTKSDGLLGDAELFVTKEELPVEESIRFRRGSSTPPSSAQQLYDASQQSLANKFYRAYVDYTKPLRDLQEIIAKESGTPIQDFENAWEAENQRSSKSKNEIEQFELKYFEDIREAVRVLEQKTGMTYNEVLNYLIAKHGLERNVVLAQRDAEADYRDYLKEQPGGPMTVNDFFLKRRKRDYSGLTALSGKQDVADAEDYARTLVQTVESMASKETDALWQTIKDAVEVIQKKRYQSGMISREQMQKEADMFDNYIPLRGFAETIAEDVYDYYEDKMRNRPQYSRRAAGRSSLADDPLATLGAMAASAIMQGNNNLMKQRFLNMVENHKTDIATIKDVWVVNHGTPSAPVWEPEYPDIHEGMDADDIRAEIERYTNRMQQMQRVGLARKATNRLNIKWRTLGQQAKQHIITVRRNGEEQMIIINGNPQVARTVNGINNPDADLSNFMRGVREVQRFMAANFTTRNPAFVVANLCRDLGFAVMAVSAKENAAYRHQFMKNITGPVIKTTKIGKLLRKWQAGTLDVNNELERYFGEFMDNGGETGYTAENTVDAFRRKMEKGLKDKNWVAKSGEALLDFFELCNRSVEDFTRFMTYMTSRQMGRTIQRSVGDAKNITVNFNRKGSGEMLQKYIASGYLFFNAGVQSLQNVAKISGIELSMDEAKGKARIRIDGKKLGKSAALLFGSQVIMGMVFPMLNEFMMGLWGGDDDDEAIIDEDGGVISTNPYRRLTEYERRNNLCLWIGGNRFIKIPLAIELRAFYGLGETIYGYMAGIPNPNPGADILTQIADLLPVNFVENNGLVPDIAAPLWQSFITNRNFMGIPLYNDSEFLENEPEANKVYSNTGDAYIALSRWINELGGGDEVSKSKLDGKWNNPAVMQNIVEGYLGGLLTTSRQTANLIGQPVKKFILGKDVEPIPARDWPVVNRLYINTNKRNDDRYIKERYYNYRDQAEKVRHDIRRYEERLDDPKYMEKYQQLLESPEYLEYITFDALNKAVKDAHQDVKEYGDEFKVFETDAMRELVNAMDEDAEAVIQPEQWGRTLGDKDKNISE